ncbi:MAG: hypothetical protein D6689_14170, partial [Deltaproteobacteria bacterium]
ARSRGHRRRRGERARRMRPLLEHAPARRTTAAASDTRWRGDRRGVFARRRLARVCAPDSAALCPSPRARRTPEIAL